MDDDFEIGPVFHTTVIEAAAVGGKNGIPDVVVQCIEYLERMELLATEGLYRVPGSVKRVKMWMQKFQEGETGGVAKGTLSRRGSLVLSRRDSMSGAARRRRSSGLSQAADDGDGELTMEPGFIFNVVEMGRKVSVGLAPVGEKVSIKGKGKEVELMNVSTAAAMGSNDELVGVSRESSKNSLVTLEKEELGRGEGLWGGEGFYSTVGFAIQLDGETSATVASLLKKFLSSVQGKFVPDQFWDPLDAIAI
ncbi:hypothetical protein HDU98_010691, partial [Podochytrium sp. JEL0797]